MTLPRKAAPQRARRNWHFFFLALLVLSLAKTIPVGAAPSPAITRKQSVRLHHIRQRINQVRDSLRRDQGLADHLQIEVQRSEQKLARGRRALHQIEHHMKTADDSLRQAEERQRKAKVMLDEERAALASQLRAAYMEQDRDPLRLFLSAQDPGLVARMLDYYAFVAQARAARIKAVRLQLTRFTKLAEQVRNRHRRLSRLRQKRQAAVLVLRRDRQSRAGAVTRLKARIASHKETLSHLEVAQRQVERLLSSLRPVLQSEPYTVGAHVPFARLRGRLPWPVRGPILARFHAPEDDGQLHWQGLWIGAPEGAPVHACARGRVVYVGWISSYGLVVLVQHGNRYFSLYGHDENVEVHPGDMVYAGQVIARAGKTGGHDRTGLYFELRHGNRVLDPVRWLTD